MATNLSNEIRLYGDFMNEIKARVHVVEYTLNGILAMQHRNSVAALSEAEKAILQVRFICELTALAALVAHNQHGLTKDLLKSYGADKTFHLLKGINPRCFPIPVTLTEGGDGKIHFAARKAELTAKGLETIYTSCGNLLHRGKLKHVLANQTRVYNLDVIFGWINKIVDLLSTHSILLQAHNGVLIAMLKGDQTEPVSVAYAEADGPFVLEPQ